MNKILGLTATSLTLKTAKVVPEFKLSQTGCFFLEKSRLLEPFVFWNGLSYTLEAS
jgi:hypothetical protein